MKLTKTELKKIQTEWDTKLREGGFKDIEQSIKPSPRVSNEEYFNLIETHLNNPDTCFKNEIHRYILTRHSQGASACIIAHELETIGTPRHRHSVRFIIRRYEAKWNIRVYSAKQLNIKVLHKPPIPLSPLEPQRSRRGICR